VPFYSYFEDIFFSLQAQHNNVIVMAVFILVHGLVIVLRLITFMGYRGHNIWLAIDSNPAKALKTISDTKSIRSHLLRRVVIDYIAVAEKNAPRVPLDAIIDKQVLELSFLGWRYTGISRWIERLDNGLILLGLILALTFSQYGVVYGILAVAGFILLKLAAAFFDYDTARRILTADIHLYVEREVGQFFAGHTASALTQLKEEMSEAVDRQSVLLRGAVENLNEHLSHLKCLADLPKSIENMQQSNDRYALHHDAFISQVQIIKDTQSALETSLASYETTLQNLVQTMGSSMGTFIQLHGQNAANSLADALQNHITRLSEGNKETIEAISILVEQLTVQNRDISTHLRALHERIEELEND